MKLISEFTKPSPVEPEKDKVSLVVEGDHLSAQKLRVLWEERGEQSADAVAQTCGEVIQDHFWIVLGWFFASSLQRENMTLDHTRLSSGMFNQI